MSADVVLRAEGISKKFSTGTRRAMYHATADIARELTWWKPPSREKRAGEFWALKDVSLELARGQAVAIIGANGAGKSTLLKLLSGLLKPDTGRVVVRGRLRAMIELGAGFAPSLSGRDNVYAQASLYGYRRHDLKSNLEAIVDFSGLESFIDAPVQQYSDGMRARLGFAIAIHLDPDLLLVDEVLAVGDIAFQNKCIAHIRGFLARGGSLAFVGHGTHQTQAVCDHGMVLVRGETKFVGTAVEATDYYLRASLAASDTASNIEIPADERRASSISIDSVEITKVGEGPLLGGSTLRISAVCTARAPAQNLGLGFTVYSASTGVCVGGGLASPAIDLPAGTGTLSCLVNDLPLTPGDYLVRLYLFDHAINYPAAVSGWEDGAHHITVESNRTPMANLARIAGMPIGIPCVWEDSQL